MLQHAVDTLGYAQLTPISLLRDKLTQQKRTFKDSRVDFRVRLSHVFTVE